MSRQNSDLDDYLTRYAATLAGFDAKAAAGMWALPGMILDDRAAGVLDDRDTMAQGLEQSFPVYQQLGLAAVGHELLSVLDLTGEIKLIHVRWLFRDADGELLTDSFAYYLVRRDGDDFRTCVCVQVDDAAKLQALAAERGVELPG